MLYVYMFTNRTSPAGSSIIYEVNKDSVLEENDASHFQISDV